jgi:subtilisin family serine protease
MISMTNFFKRTTLSFLLFVILSSFFSSIFIHKSVLLSKVSMPAVSPVFAKKHSSTQEPKKTEEKDKKPEDDSKNSAGDSSGGSGSQPKAASNENNARDSNSGSGSPTNAQPDSSKKTDSTDTLQNEKPNDNSQSSSTPTPSSSSSPSPTPSSSPSPTTSSSPSSTLNGTDYGVDSGTSMAAPHVAGAAALFKAENPHATPQQIMNMVLNSSSKPATACHGGPQGYFSGDVDLLKEPLLFREPPLSYTSTTANATLTAPVPVAKN